MRKEAGKDELAAVDPGELGAAMAVACVERLVVAAMHITEQNNEVLRPAILLSDLFARTDELRQLTQSTATDPNVILAENQRYVELLEKAGGLSLLLLCVVDLLSKRDAAKDAAT